MGNCVSGGCTPSLVTREGSVNVVIHLLHDSPLVHEQEEEEQPAAASLFLELLASSTGIQLLQDSPFMHRHEECGWGVQLEAASLGLSLLPAPPPRFLFPANSLLALHVGH